MVLSKYCQHCFAVALGFTDGTWEHLTNGKDTVVLYLRLDDQPAHFPPIKVELDMRDEAMVNGVISVKDDMHLAFGELLQRAISDTKVKMMELKNDRPEVAEPGSAPA